MSRDKFAKPAIFPTKLLEVMVQLAGLLFVRGVASALEKETDKSTGLFLCLMRDSVSVLHKPRITGARIS